MSEPRGTIADRRRRAVVVLGAMLHVLLIVAIAAQGFRATGPYLTIEQTDAYSFDVQKVTLSSGVEVSESTSTDAVLARVDVMYAARGHAPLRLEVIDADGRRLQDLERSVPPAELPTFIAFEFAQDRRGRAPYELRFSAPAAGAGLAVTLFGSTCDCNEHGSADVPTAALDEAPESSPPVVVRDLHVATFSRPGEAKRVATVLDRMEAFRPSWLGTPVLLVAACLSVLVLGGLIGLVLARAVDGATPLAAALATTLSLVLTGLLALI